MSNGQTTMATLFTIGYEQHQSPDSLIEALRAARVPLSRKRGFSESPLAQALAAWEIEYEHVRDLGNPKPYRDLYKSGRVREGERRYRAHLHNGSYRAVVDLGETLEEVPTCLFCFEASYEECHRAVIVKALCKPEVTGSIPARSNAKPAGNGGFSLGGVCPTVIKIGPVETFWKLREFGAHLTM